MNQKNIFLSVGLFLSLTTLCDEDKKDAQSLREQIKQKMEAIGEECQTIQQQINKIVGHKYEQLKDKWNNTIDEFTQRSAQEIKQDILEHLKSATCYTAAITQPKNTPSDLTRSYIAWCVLKGFELPKDAIQAYYSHCIVGQKKFSAWKQGVKLANQELNAERSK